MGEFVKIKQIDGLGKQLDSLTSTSQQALAIAIEVKDAMGNTGAIQNKAKEQFNGIFAKEYEAISLKLSFPITDPATVQVFFNGVLVENVKSNPGDTLVQISVPYITEPDDTIIVYYTH